MLEKFLPNFMSLGDSKYVWKRSASYNSSVCMYFMHYKENMQNQTVNCILNIINIYIIGNGRENMYYMSTGFLKPTCQSLCRTA